MPDRVKEKLSDLLYEASRKADPERYIFDQIADILIANGVTALEWISVKDRLPEDDLPQDTDRKQIRCLVATDKGAVKPCVRQRYKKKIDGQWQLCEWEWNKDLFAKPTHWQYLPQPPKGE